MRRLALAAIGRVVDDPALAAGLRYGEPPYQLTALKAVFGDVMSEYVLGWLLALERRVLVHSRSKRWLTGRESSVRGKRMGIMGTGSIGTVVAQRANAFGIECVGLNRDGRTVPGFERCYATIRPRLPTETHHNETCATSRRAGTTRAK